MLPHSDRHRGRSFSVSPTVFLILLCSRVCVSAWSPHHSNPFPVQGHECPRFQLSDDSRDICTLSLSLELDLRLLPRHFQVSLLQRPQPNMSKTSSSLRHKNKSKQTVLPMFHIPVNGTINHPMLPNLHPIFLLQLLPPIGHQSLSILSHLLNLFSFFFFFFFFLIFSLSTWPRLQSFLAWHTEAFKQFFFFLFSPSNINY